MTGSPVISLTTEVVTAPLVTTYKYARSSDSSCVLARVTITDGVHVGWGEGSPFASFFESDTSATRTALDNARALVSAGAAIPAVLETTADMPARNAVDSAWIDFQAKRDSVSAADLLGIDQPGDQIVMTTIAMGSEQEVVNDLHRTRRHPLLKLKMGDSEDRVRLALVRQFRPDARLVVDVNGGWTPQQLEGNLKMLVEHDVEMLEQPLASGADRALSDIDSPVPIVADESFSTLDDVERLTGLYDGINIKLDKCGGLTAALQCIEAARTAGFKIMVGCLPASSLSTAAGLHAAQFAEWVDLDNHLWLRDDVTPSIPYADGQLRRAPKELWG